MPSVRLAAELDAVFRARSRQCLGVGVGDDELGAARARPRHVVDGVAAGAADADDDDAWLQVRILRRLHLRIHDWSSEAFPQPVSDALKIAGLFRCAGFPLISDTGAGVERDLGQADCRRKHRIAPVRRQAGHGCSRAIRTGRQNALGQVLTARQLASSAGEHDAVRCKLADARTFETLGNVGQQIRHAVGDDVLNACLGGLVQGRLLLPSQGISNLPSSFAAAPSTVP